MKSLIKNRVLLIIYLILCFISVGSIVSAYFLTGYWQAVLIAFAINILTSLLVVIIIDNRLDKERAKLAEKQEKEYEKKSILANHQLVESILPIFKLQFNQLTIPQEERIRENVYQQISDSEFNKNLKLQAMLSVLQPNITLYGEFNETSLDSFERIHNKLISIFENILINTKFKHYLSIQQSIVNIIRTALQPSCMHSWGLLIKQKSIKDTIQKMVDNYQGDIFNDYNTNKYSGNLFLQPLTLLRYLCLIKDVIESYIELIENLKQEK